MSRDQATVRRLRRVATFLGIVAALATTASAQEGPPTTFSKVFSPDTIGRGSVSTLTFTITNDDSVPVENLAFTDNLPAGVTIATPASAVSDCLGASGTLSAPDGGGTITLAGGTVGGASSCTVIVAVTSSTEGTHTNVSGALTSDAGNSGTATADLTVDTGLPGFSKSFSPSVVPLGDRSTLTFTIDNNANESGVGNLDFTDNLPVGMVVADPANAVTDCISASLPDTTLTAIPGTGTIILDANGNTIFAGLEVLAAGATCTVTVDVVATGTGQLGNVSGDLLADFVSSGKASATLAVTVTPLALVKTFTDDPVHGGGTATLEFTITNRDRLDSATGIAFTDNLEAALTGLVATGLPKAACGGTLTGTSTLALTGASVGPEASCTFSVPVQVPGGTTAGAYLNTTEAITGTVGGSPVVGNKATDKLFVSDAPDLSKDFLVDPVAAGGTTTLEFTITNASETSSATDIAFLDELTNNLPFPVSATLPTTPCGPSSALSLVAFDSDRQRLELTGGQLAASGSAGDSCTFTVDIDIPVGMPGGVYVNTTGEITATVGGETQTGGAASDSLTIAEAPTLRKSFTDDPVLPGGQVTLEFTIGHADTAPGDATGIAFTDDLTGTLSGLAASGLPLNDVCGAGSTISGTTNLSFTGGILTPGETCTFSVSLTVPAATIPGDYSNTTSSVTATASGLTVSGNPASDDLRVSGLSLTKEFVGDPVGPGDTVVLHFTLENQHPTDGATGISFTDSLSTTLAGLTYVSALPASTCGGTLTGVAGSFLFFSGGTLAQGAPPCTFDVTLQVPAGAADGTYLNQTSNLTATIGMDPATLPPATDILTVQEQQPPSFFKAFSPETVGPGSVSTLTFTIDNAAELADATGLDFTDNLPAGLTIATPANAGTTCTGGTLTASAGSGVVSYTGGSVAAGATCTLSVDVTGTTLGAHVNTTGDLTSSAGNSGTATATLNVGAITLEKSFTDDPVEAGRTVTLEFTITNNNTTVADNIGFTDDLDAAVVGLAATGPSVSDVCGSGSLISGTGLLTFSGGLLDPGASCTFSLSLRVPVVTPAGLYPSTTSGVVARVSGYTLNGVPASDVLEVLAAPPLSRDDFDGDGMSDIMWRNDTTQVPLLWFMDSETVAVEVPFSPIAEKWREVGVGDFNGDSRADILWRELGTGKTYMWLMDGGTRLPGTGFTSRHGAESWVLETLGDFDGDRNSDIVWRYKGPDSSLKGAVYLWLMSGTQVLKVSGVGAAGLGWELAGATDFDGDGADDLLWRETTTGKTYVWFEGGLSAAPRGFTSAQKDNTWTVEGLGDLDGDRMGDVVWRNTLTGEAYVWLMDGVGVHDEASLGPASLSWKLVGVGDFSGDRRVDLLWRKTASGETYMWFMDGVLVIGRAFTDLQLNTLWRIDNPK